MYCNADAAAPFQPTLGMTLRGHHHGVRSVAFQPAPSSTVVTPKVISGGMDGAVISWDTAATARAVRFTGHRGPVLSVSYSSHPHLFASGGQDGYVRVWSPDERRSVAVYSAYPDGRAKNCACAWRAHTGATRAVAFAKDGSDRLYTIGDDKAVKSWDLAMLSSAHSRAKRMTNRFAGGFSASPVTEYSACGHTTRVTALAVPRAVASSHLVHYVASGGDDGVVFVWDTRSRDAAHVIYGRGGGVNSLSFHPDGYVLASGDEAGDINLFDLRRSSSSAPGASGADGGGSYSLLQHYSAAHMDAGCVGTRGVDFAPNGGWLLSSGDDGTTKLWDVKEGHLYCTVQAHDGPVAASCFSDDGAWFVTGGGADKTVLIWRSGLAACCAARALVPATATASSTSMSVCSSEGRVAAPSSPPHVVADHTTSRSSTPARSAKAGDTKRKPEATSPSRLVTRSTSADRPAAAQSRRPPIPLAPPSTNALLSGEFVAPPVDDSAVRQNADTSVNSERERSFERCEQRYSHLGAPSSPAQAESGSTADVAARRSATANGAARSSSETSSAHVRALKAADADRVAGEEREQEQLQAQERAHHREQRERILEERVANLEDAVAALVGYMQQQQTQQEEHMKALQAASKEQAERSDAGVAELKRAIELLTSRISSGGATKTENAAELKSE
ncbi:hypothetical protein ABB37_03210 [Leptomonas pyrrhocoris]|uniref:Uncharacterized protein n=1 Tax=Leptomonas pyrrhocoris TaxID=157538 RepID=A0A0N0DWU6_LEPPY|nr:hypothetical protein ABB37_03210 [Leptomonas pyrrhocoris]XP_015660482.1 hypothetical protein ABB37_03210 [Leptomonas pyrrhocoris]KPA82042.1 hypothetical protein ABB37_03210 [Leptomonas pyrrhocoris]KPA82043.1 hypothetical protein ABB37_03210 [Leptomonas pyrrhocoris]|eukprot:XP_015660481.1 hypothetical protein ABB37_03210 [Leptomonas pyrrhocoris]